MHIIQTVPRLEKEASGPSYSVPRLAGALAERGHRVSLLSVGGLAESLSLPVPSERGAQDFTAVPMLRSLVLSRAFEALLGARATEADLIHANGLWLMPNIYPAWAAAAANRPLIVSPRGTLSQAALARSAWRKRLFWALLQSRAVAQAACLHATSEQEYQDIRRFGLRQPVAVIPNGVDLPPAAPARETRTRRRLLYLGRLHPIKGVENLLTAWGSLQDRFADWELKLVGPGEPAYVAGLEAQAAGLRRASFGGPRFGADKTQEYAAADLYVLPSFSENFAMTVAEALASGLPVITTTGTPWTGLETEGCGWRVTPTADALAGAMAQAMDLTPDDLGAVGERGRAYVLRAFSWDRVAGEMESVYRWVLTGGVSPPAVRLD